MSLAFLDVAPQHGTQTLLQVPCGTLVVYMVLHVDPRLCVLRAGPVGPPWAPSHPQMGQCRAAWSGRHRGPKPVVNLWALESHMLLEPQKSPPGNV